MPDISILLESAAEMAQALLGVVFLAAAGLFFFDREPARAKGSGAASWNERRAA